MGHCCICKKLTDTRCVRVPQKAAKRKLWSESTGIEFSDNTRVCEKHFKESDFYYADESKKIRKLLRKDAVPITSDRFSKFTEHFPSTLDDNKRDFGSQTEKEVVEAGIALENLRYKIKVQELQKEIAKLMQQLKEANHLNKTLSRMFTKSQVQHLHIGGTPRWKQDDISYAVNLHAAGPRAYRHLYKKGFPLPCESTLKKWCQSVVVKPGILDKIFERLKNDNIADEDKICTLMLDEIKLSAEFEWEAAHKDSSPVKDYVQVAMVQGLRKTWKQPIYFDYDTLMTVTILRSLIQKLYDAGYHVVALVSDMRVSYSKIWKDLEIGPDKTWFEHPSNTELKIFVFADAPNLLKLLRQHYLESGVVMECKLITAEPIKQAMIRSTASDLSVWHMTKAHFSTMVSTREQIKLATQLLSKTTAYAIMRCHELGLDIINASETAKFIELVNDWYEIFNTKMSTDKIKSHSDTLERMNTFMAVPFVPNAKKCPPSEKGSANGLKFKKRCPFQKGFVVSNNSLGQLYTYLADQYNMEYLITSRLSHDVLEDFFGESRLKDGLHDRPSTVEFKYRMRNFILGNLED